MGYHSRWTATDQVPQRLIDAGTLNGQPFGRYASLDPTTGGSSSRASLSGEWHKQSAAGRSSLSAYAISYDLDLNSNFTYALDRPSDGDQFKQTDRRGVYGFDAEHRFEHDVGSLPFSTSVGLQVRHDRIRNGLYDSVARRITGTVREDRIQQTQTGLWLQSAVELTPTLRTVIGSARRPSASQGRRAQPGHQQRPGERHPGVAQTGTHLVGHPADRTLFQHRARPAQQRRTRPDGQGRPAHRRPGRRRARPGAAAGQRDRAAHRGHSGAADVGGNLELALGV